MTREDVVKVVVDAIHEQTGERVVDLTTDLTTIGMDDVEFVCVVMAVEEALNVQLVDDAPFQVRTVDDIIRLVTEAISP